MFVNRVGEALPDAYFVAASGSAIERGVSGDWAEHVHAPRIVRNPVKLSSRLFTFYSSIVYVIVMYYVFIIL